MFFTCGIGLVSSLTRYLGWRLRLDEAQPERLESVRTSNDRFVGTASSEPTPVLPSIPSLTLPEAAWDNHLTAVHRYGRAVILIGVNKELALFPREDGWAVEQVQAYSCLQLPLFTPIKTLLPSANTGFASVIRLLNQNGLFVFND